jgi:hypothetical protein
MNQTAGYQHGITRAGPRLGSVKTRQLNYTRDHTFYHGENVIAPQVTQAVKGMKDLTDRDLLGRKKPEWNQSVLVPGAQTLTYSFEHPVKTERNQFLIRTGIKDETIVAPKEGKVYAGTDTRNVHYDGWNVSIQCPLPRHVHRYLQEETRYVQAKTKQLANDILAAKGDYRPPEQLTVALNAQRRQEKLHMESERVSLAKQVKYDLPRASKNRVDAIVFRELQERKHVEEIVPDDPELTLRPDTSKTLKPTAQRRYYHTGKWEKS